MNTPARAVGNVIAAFGGLMRGYKPIDASRMTYADSDNSVNIDNTVQDLLWRNHQKNYTPPPTLPEEVYMQPTLGVQQQPVQQMIYQPIQQEPQMSKVDLSKYIKSLKNNQTVQQTSDSTLYMDFSKALTPLGAQLEGLLEICGMLVDQNEKIIKLLSDNANTVLQQVQQPAVMQNPIVEQSQALEEDDVNSILEQYRGQTEEYDPDADPDLNVETPSI